MTAQLVLFVVESKVFFDVVVSLDGFIAPEGMEMAHASDPGYKNWMNKWTALQSWVFQQKFFRENLKLGEGGETGTDNRLLEETFKRTGVSIMGKRMFDGGERYWPDDAPFHTPVFVLTHQVRKPWERPGGTTFYFVNDGVESALREARKVVGRRDIRVSGGANVIQQFLNAGLVDEFTLHYSPVFFGQGTPLLSGITENVKVKIKNSFASKDVTHVTYQLEKTAAVPKEPLIA
ncbi:MAG TPA: dihydrofolate reductase family protein [Candidatus Bathyarchaeia archaeon]|nr:dihydrofolate reductase family protein [Candidatus Bathyarchaeia archaeon]